jgi:hypothetical protein
MARPRLPDLINGRGRAGSPLPVPGNNDGNLGRSLRPYHEART